ncbi:GvpL/GvpF family gas vesicle protein [Sphaerisporangium sp. NPDC088356]|uniref:GvpL/GvpF family gas vesicle protein n=1 Tax=Sphaerisporangium sp. NPDC088356 TaxID=3154871 RepID=UPI00341F66E8
MARSTPSAPAPGSGQDTRQDVPQGSQAPKPGGGTRTAAGTRIPDKTREAAGAKDAQESGTTPKAERRPGQRGEDSGAAGVPGEQATASYIYGILPGDVELTPEARGVGDPPGEIRLVRHEDIAALISDLRLNRPLGMPQDLVAHQSLLDDVAAEVPVLPLRFGAVMESPEAVVRELLAPHHDEFRSALEDLEDRAQYVVKARYEEGTVLREVLQEQPEARRLREEIRDLPEEATWDARIRLGEVINEAIEAKRAADTQTLAEGLAPHAVAVVIREPTHEVDAAHLAVLVETGRQDDFEEALNEFGRRWADRVTLRLLGPQAPYDFVTTQR